MPGSSTTPGRVDARFHAPTRVAFRIRNGVGTRDKNLYEAQWLACVLLYRRFAAALTGVCARLEADVVSYSFIVSDLHRLLVAGLPAHCERFCTLSLPAGVTRVILFVGFAEMPSVPDGVRYAQEQAELSCGDLSEVSYYIGRETVLPTTSQDCGCGAKRSMHSCSATRSVRQPISVSRRHKLVEIGIEIEI